MIDTRVTGEEAAAESMPAPPLLLEEKRKEGEHLAKMTNRDEYEKLSKKQLIELARMYGRFALSLDGLWFLGVERFQGTEEAIKLDEDVWRRFGKSEAMLLKRFLSLDRVNSLDDICRIFLLAPVFGNLGGQAEVRDDRCLLSVTDCHPQKARIRKNLGEFPCKTVGRAYFESLLAEMNPEIRFRCVVCPPDEHPDDLWCEWEVWMERNADT